ncbi:hypothetical protein GGTG_12797 [Gaeumannomyces tritici R3-111a-1]|uniref:Major facilitator superfamily (MFS) profile domain-containing protein n=1 Tax=Gaeumannomyces tritici (strain R3-111a-1) TaxID=644352 RepID=J3PH17_GAET3|nr:hypothetical protein GGTG_12797 [Gaeumannomyces tritici R3-111a-1]EJT69914.1 hypothetical protein GGTG_12797 [Gaeumannomyces tritici R3-111a-1]
MLGCSIATAGGLTGMADFRARLSPGGFGPVVHGFVVGAFPVGCLVGCVLAGRFADTLGLIRSMLMAAISACVGISIQIGTISSWPQFAAGKLVEGFAIGALSVITPMYHAETAPASIRAMVTVSFQIMVVSGILLAQLVIYGTSNIPNSLSWRLPLALEILIAVPLGIGSFFLPESPRLLLSQDREQEARVVIAKLNDVDVFHPTVQDQVQAFHQKSIEAKSQEQLKRCELFTAPAMARRLLIGIMLQAARHRSAALAIATAANWTVNAAIGISTSHILAKIHFKYGYFFAASCLALAFGVWRFLIEPKDRAMDEIDQLYLEKADARKAR